MTPDRFVDRTTGRAGRTCGATAPIDPAGWQGVSSGDRAVVEHDTIVATPLIVHSTATILGQSAGTAHATRDALTGLLAHGSFYEALAGLRMRCRAEGGALTLTIVTIDDLDRLNRDFGHRVGDRIICHVTHLMNLGARPDDVLGRLRGDTFAWASRGITLREAERAAEALLDRVVQSPLTCNAVEVAPIISIGLAESGRGFAECETALVAAASEAQRLARRRVPRRIATHVDVEDRHADDIAIPGEGDDETQARWNRRLRQVQLESVMLLVSAVEAKDPYTERHSMNVSLLAEHLARTLQVPADLRETIVTAALLHDVGKIGVPDVILTKPGKLTRAEFEIIKKHPGIGVEVLRHATFLKSELPIVLHHHEWYNGRGYPSGLQAEEIPYGARILHVADSIDAMLSPRSYKDSYPVDRVLSELRRGAGTQFDPQVAAAGVEWLSRRET